MTCRISARKALLACLASISLLNGCSSPTASLSALQPAPTGPYRVASGDKLHIVIQDFTYANGEYTVEDGGMVSLPYLNQIKAAGKTYREIEQSIATSLLAQGIMSGAPAVNVAPVELRPFYVVGEVNKPGEFSYRQGMTVLSALSAAGGYTYRASTKYVAITRTIDGGEMTARATESTAIQPGDRIRVFERWF
jgi:polysaccharide export outer membrane protein